MQKIKIGFILLITILLINISGIVLAQEVAPLIQATPEVLSKLPNPGLKHGDFFHFLDRWGEAVQELFTFNPEARAVLQTRFALERVAEIKATLEEKGVDAPGLAVAEERIKRNIKRAANILERQRARGIEVSQLAQRLDSDFNAREVLLREIFSATRGNLKREVGTIRDQIKEARLAENFERVDELRATLTEIESRKERIDVRKDFLREMFGFEKERIKAQMEGREREFRKLAEQAEDLFEQKEREAEQVIEEKEKILEAQKVVLEEELRQAIFAEDLTLVEQIRAQLLAIERQEQVIEQEEEVLEKRLEQNKERLRRAMAMQERAKEQIEEVKEKIVDIKEEIMEKEVEVSENILNLIKEAEDKLMIAEELFKAENYGQAFGQAMAAERLVRNAKRILDMKERAIEKQEKLEEIQEKIREGVRQERRREVGRGERIVIACRVDADCQNLICPMVLGSDTPRCNTETRQCYCGPSDYYLEREAEM